MPLKRIPAKIAAKARAGAPCGRAAPVSAAERRALLGLKGGNDLARHSALASLRRFGPKYERLAAEAMKDPFPVVVEAAIESLAEISPRKNAPLIASKILDLDDSVSAQAIFCSAKIGNRRAIPLLRKAALDRERSAYVRAYALKVLAETFGVREPALRRAAQELTKRHVMIDLSRIG
jgi:HEAT repeat protein